MASWGPFPPRRPQQEREGAPVLGPTRCSLPTFFYGAGHLGWLQYAFDSNPDIRLRKLADFAR